MHKTFLRLFAEGAAVGAFIVAVVLFILAFFGVGQLAQRMALLPLVALGSGIILGLFYAMFRYLGAACRQHREAMLECDFDTACRLIQESLSLFPRHMLIDSRPGFYEIVVNNNPLMKPFSTHVVAKKWAWAETITILAEPMGSSTRIHINGIADLNRAGDVVFSKKRHNVDLILEYCTQTVDGA